MQGKESTYSGLEFDIFRERECDFFLGLRAIRPSEFVGTRGKVVLLSEGFVWVPDLRNLDKLFEVGVSPYLGFTLYFIIFQCFDYLEALNGRLIGPKTWDRIGINF